MSVGFANAVAAGLHYNGIPVSFEPGWETRGNGFSFPGGMPQGLIEHHTGDAYGAGLSILVNGRPDLDPPLCNCCTYPDGRIHIIAAQPANHAGAAAGRSLGPFTPGGLFNNRVWGNEIMYPGSRPMTAAQRRSALVLGGVICGITKHSVEYIRLHAETSGEGKWDPGDGPGRTIDGARFRADIWPALTRAPSLYRLGDDMAGEWVTTPTPETHKITYPVGPKVSSLVAKGWLSIHPSEDGAIEVWVHGKGGSSAVIDHWTEPIKANTRWWKELRDGTESCTVQISTARTGVAGWCLELKEA